MLNQVPPETSVLFVCLGNICRSPMAEGAFRDAADKAGLNVIVDSAGTSDYHLGSPPDRRAIATARSHGVDISALSGRQLREEDFYTFTHIFALDSANMAGINARAPRGGTAKVAHLLDVVEGCRGGSVPDPYYGDEKGFEDCWQTINNACENLAKALAKEGVAATF